MQGKRTNNPDQVGVSYMTIQSVPHDKIEQLNACLLYTSRCV